MRRAQLVGLAVLWCLLVGRCALRLEPPVDRPWTEFSGDRAKEQLFAIARAPRPTGSPENERVRRALCAYARGLGFEPEIQSGTIEGTLVHNVVVRIPGRGGEGTLLAAAHYDTVATSPGAADDGAGVATLMELLRLASEKQLHERDLVVAFTDGEERHMLGAKLLARRRDFDPVFVVNIDAVGGGGPVALLECGTTSGAYSGAVARAYASEVRAPAATSSFAAWLFHRLPLNTDFSVLATNAPGVNLTLVDGATSYHAPADTAAQVDPDSLQDLGDTTLAMLRWADGIPWGLQAEHSASPAHAAYQDVLGRSLWVWPAAWSRVLLIAGGLVAVGLLARALRAGGDAWAAFYLVLAIPLAAAMSSAVGALEGVLGREFEYFVVLLLSGWIAGAAARRRGAPEVALGVLWCVAGWLEVERVGGAAPLVLALPVLTLAQVVSRPAVAGVGWRRAVAAFLVVAFLSLLAPLAMLLFQAGGLHPRLGNAMLGAALTLAAVAALGAVLPSELRATSRR